MRLFDKMEDRRLANDVEEQKQTVSATRISKPASAPRRLCAVFHALHRVHDHRPAVHRHRTSHSRLPHPACECPIVFWIYYLPAGQREQIPTFSIMMLAAIYGLQALVFILAGSGHGGLDGLLHLGHPRLFVLRHALFVLAHGRSRLGSDACRSCKNLIVHDEGKFDPRVIPLKSWTDYVGYLVSISVFAMLTAE